MLVSCLCYASLIVIFCVPKLTCASLYFVFPICHHQLTPPLIPAWHSPFQKIHVLPDHSVTCYKHLLKHRLIEYNFNSNPPSFPPRLPDHKCTAVFLHGKPLKKWHPTIAYFSPAIPPSQYMCNLSTCPHPPRVVYKTYRYIYDAAVVMIENLIL